LEPTAVGNLLQLLQSALAARAADEGHSFFSRQGDGTRIGEQVIDERLSVLSDPTDPDLLAPPFAADGMPLSHTKWIENGVLQNLEYDRYWASRQGREPLPRGGGIKLTGAEGTTDDLVSTVNRGLLVTRFWYVRPVDQRRLMYTGLTRDGMFLIEDGRIVRPVSNMRFNESIVSILNNVESIGAAVRVVASESGGLGVPVVVPPVVVRDFHFTSGSDAI
jgi:predicted Zn-dependent protease